MSAMNVYRMVQVMDEQPDWNIKSIIIADNEEQAKHYAPRDVNLYYLEGGLGTTLRETPATFSIDKIGVADEHFIYAELIANQRVRRRMKNDKN